MTKNSSLFIVLVVVSSIFLASPSYGVKHHFNTVAEEIIILFEGKPIEETMESSKWDFGLFTKGQKKQKVLTFLNQTSKDIPINLSTTSKETTIHPSSFVLKSKETSFCTLTVEPEYKEESNGYGDSLQIRYLETKREFRFNYWFQTDYRSITLWKDEIYFYTKDLDVAQKKYFPLYMPPIIHNDRMYVEVRFLQELGYNCQPNLEKDISLTLYFDEDVLYFEPSKNRVVINSQPVLMDNASLLIWDMKMFLPVRFLAEYAGYEVMWDPDEEKVILLWDKLGGEE